jgi:ankyrin repeat protein
MCFLASGLVEPWTSPVIGFTGGFISFFGLKFFKHYLRLDDVLDVSSLQGVPGLFGSLCVGLFACPQMQGANPELGLFYGGGMALMWKQLLAVCLSFGWSFFWTYLIMLFMKQTIGIDVSVEAEEQGLDLTQMGEQAYDEQLEPLLDLGKDVLVFKLCEASAEGRLKDIQMLLRASADPYVGDYDKRTPLHLAASGGHLAVMQYLEAHCPFLKVDALDVNGTTPMNDAFTSGSLPCIQWIKKRGGHLGDQESVERIFFNAAVEGDARTVELAAATGLSVDAVDYDGRSALMLAASEGHKPVVLVLLEEKADVHARDRWNNNALDAADLGGHEDIYMVIAKSMNIIVGSFDHNPDTNTPLLESDVLLNNQAGIERLRESKGDADHIPKRKKVILTGGQRELCDAAAKGNLEELQRLIKKGGDKNLGDYDGRTPLILATVGGHIRTVSYLLDQPGITINAQDRWHNTAYKLACDQNFHEIATLLREKGAAIVNDNIGYYLCLHASKNNRAPIEKILKDGSSVNLSDYDCRTALHLAASNGHKDLVEWLLAQGANPNLQDRFGFTSLDDAKRHDHPEIVRLLSSKMNVRRVNFAASEGANQVALVVVVILCARIFIYIIWSFDKNFYGARMDANNTI